MPKKTIGNRYVLGSNVAHATEETVKVVTVKDGVRFSYGGDCYTSTEERQVFTFHRPSNRIVEVIADDQILVAQFIQASSSALPDSVMNLAVPYRQWSTSYEVYVPARNSLDAYESILLCLLTQRDTILQFTGLQVFSCWFREKSLFSAVYDSLSLSLSLFFFSLSLFPPPSLSFVILHYLFLAGIWVVLPRY